MKRKLFKKFGLITALASFAITTPALAIACAPDRNRDVFRYFYNTDILKDNNSPLNTSFNNSPISTYAGTVVYGLVSYKTLEADPDPEKPGVTKFRDELMLEAATDLEIFKSEDQMKQYDRFRNAENKPYVFKSGEALSKQENYHEAISSGTVYRFKINTDNYWVDSRGNKKEKVSSKDFERGIEVYSLASDIGYNRNGYFIGLAGLDLNKTVGYESNGNYVEITDPNYDIKNYANDDDRYFTLHLTSPYPYTLDLLTKEYFTAMPHKNKKVENIHLGENSPIKYTKDDKGRITIDNIGTNFNEIYGSGDIHNFHKDAWFAGSYYISDFTSTQIIYQLNQTYVDNVGSYILDPKEKRIPTIVQTYGSGTVDTYYELFKSGQNDYLPSVPATRKSEAAQHYIKKELKLFSNSKIPQSNYMSYTPKPYVISKDGITTNTNIQKKEANFINDWMSEDSIVIRAGINGLINHKILSYINLPSSGDFQLSSVPYGNYQDYYEAVSGKDSKFMGGLPRPYSDYLNETSLYMTKSFSIPIYKVVDGKIEITPKEINKDVFHKALENSGFTKSSKMLLNIKFGEGSFTNNYTNYLNQLEHSIETLSDGRIEVTILARNAANPTANEWFRHQSSVMGFNYWSPDYNGVGTWLESYNLLGDVDYNGKSYEGYTQSNAHNSWNTYFQAMVSSIKIMNAKWDSSEKKYIVGTHNNDPYEKDNKVQGAFSIENINKLKIDLDDAQKEMKPGVLFGNIGVKFVNYLIDKKVINQENFQKYVDDLSKIKTKKDPRKPEDIIIGSDAIISGQSGEYTKYLGVFAGEEDINALWTTFVNDSDYSYIPRSESGVSEYTFALVNKDYKVKISTVGSINFRDFEIVTSPKNND